MSGAGTPRPGAPKLFRRWLAYRRLLDELADAPAGALRDIGICRTALADFAWHCAGLSSDPDTGRATPDGA